MAFEGVETRARRAAFLRSNNERSSFLASKRKQPHGKPAFTEQAVETLRAQRAGTFIEGLLKGNK